MYIESYTAEIKAFGRAMSAEFDGCRLTLVGLTVAEARQIIDALEERLPAAVLTIGETT